MTKARDIASAAPAPSTVSATEIGYLDGVTSAIQTQIDSKIGSASAISPTLIDAKGDLIVGSAADTAARLAVGTNDYVLTADSSATNGVKWAAASGGMTLIQRSTFSGVANTSTTFDGVFTSTYTNYMIVFEKFNAATLADDLQIQFRYSGVTDTAYYAGLKQAPVDSATWTNTYSGAAGAACPLATDSNSTNPFTGVMFARIDTSGNNYVLFHGHGYEIYNSEYCLFHGSSDALRVYTGFILKSASSNVSGTVAVYGLANS